MMAKMQRPILVTGAHRSGTTWVGKVLAYGARVAYISEPLNVLHRPGVFQAPVPHWYTYICNENEQRFLPAFRHLLHYKYFLWDEIQAIQSGHDFLRMGRDIGRFIYGWFSKSQPVIKDPFAVFSAPWFAERLNAQVVITVRHPAAFVSSLKRLAWPFDLNDLLAQPLLLRDWLGPVENKIREIVSIQDDLVSTAAILWKIIYGTVHQFRERYPNFIIERHEDLSLDPQAGFRSLFNRLGLKFNRRAFHLIESASNQNNPPELINSQMHSIHLNSRENVYNWQHRLTTDEIARIRAITEDIAIKFYTDEEWYF